MYSEYVIFTPAYLCCRQTSLITFISCGLYVYAGNSDWSLGAQANAHVTRNKRRPAT
jgi:hypothetical protein